MWCELWFLDLTKYNSTDLPFTLTQLSIAIQLRPGQKSNSNPNNEVILNKRSIIEAKYFFYKKQELCRKKKNTITLLLEWSYCFIWCVFVFTKSYSLMTTGQRILTSIRTASESLKWKKCRKSPTLGDVPILPIEVGRTMK